MQEREAFGFSVGFDPAVSTICFEEYLMKFDWNTVVTRCVCVCVGREGAAVEFKGFKGAGPLVFVNKVNFLPQDFSTH